MDERIVQFISALRASGIRVSIAESVDAFSGINLMGVRSRELFRLTLRSTLIKDSRGFPIFEELFPLFFGNVENPPMQNILDNLSNEEVEMLREALNEFTRRLRQLLEKLMRGEPLAQDELNEIGQLVGLPNADDLRYREWMEKRMQQAFGLPKIQEALRELQELLQAMGMNPERIDEIQQLVRANLEAISGQIRQYVGESIASNLSQNEIDDELDEILNRPFKALSEHDMNLLRNEVKRLATLLRSRVALRQKRAKSGQLDPKATIRANLKHNSIPIEIKHKNYHLKPKLVVICDISTSMRYCSELMLSLVYHLQDQISKTNAFAFISHLEFVSPDFVERDANQAVRSVLDRMPSGYYNTDFGYSLENFRDDYLDTLDNRTTLIIVGDGRNNFNDPGLDIFRTLTQRAKTTLWFNPESPYSWGSGDSDMLKYAPFCRAILQVQNMAELTSAIDQLFV